MNTYVSVVKYIDHESGWVGYYSQEVGNDSVKVITDPITGPWDTEGEAEREATEYALRNDIPLRLRDDPDGLWSDLAIQQMLEKNERIEAEQTWRM
jgi:hypothetical protein